MNKQRRRCIGQRFLSLQQKPSGSWMHRKNNALADGIRTYLGGGGPTRSRGRSSKTSSRSKERASCKVQTRAAVKCRLVFGSRVAIIQNKGSLFFLPVIPNPYQIAPGAGRCASSKAVDAVRLPFTVIRLRGRVEQGRLSRLRGQVRPGLHAQSTCATPPLAPGQALQQVVLRQRHILAVKA